MTAAGRHRLPDPTPSGLPRRIPGKNFPAGLPRERTRYVGRAVVGADGNRWSNDDEAVGQLLEALRHWAPTE